MAVQTQWRHPRVYLWAKESIALKMDVSEDVIAFQREFNVLTQEEEA